MCQNIGYVNYQFKHSLLRCRLKSRKRRTVQLGANDLYYDYSITQNRQTLEQVVSRQPELAKPEVTNCKSSLQDVKKSNDSSSERPLPLDSHKPNSPDEEMHLSLESSSGPPFLPSFKIEESDVLKHEIKGSDSSDNSYPEK